MFTIEKLWENPKLAPLKKAHENNQMDRRLVVVINDSSDVNIAETEALHAWLEQQQYSSIPDEWETDDLDILQVVHVSKLSVAVLRRNPFTTTPQPLAPNSWLNKLGQNEFDAILLAQSMGEIANVPTQREIKDQIKPGIEQPTAFWVEMIANVEFCKSGQAPKNTKQKQLLAHWRNAESRRHYDSTSQSIVSESPIAQTQPVVIEREYIWFGPGEEQYRWNQRLTQLRDWIAIRSSDNTELRNVAVEILGTNGMTQVSFSSQLRNTAHSLVEKAMWHNKLSELAARFDYVQSTTTAPSVFNTGGNAFIGGNINVGGDFVGRDKIVVNNIAGSRGVAIGSNINQTVIITGDNNTIA